MSSDEATLPVTGIPIDSLRIAGALVRARIESLA